MTIKEIPFGTRNPDKKAAAFVLITGTTKLYENYEDDSMTTEYKNAYYPVVLMVHRWDGRMGFPGGFVDANETLENAAYRELREETGYDLKEKLQPLVSHELSKITIHAFHLDFGKCSMEQLKGILRSTTKSKDSICEVCPVWVHLQDYGQNKGLTVTLNSNILVSGVKEELEFLLNKQNKEHEGF